MALRVASTEAAMGKATSISDAVPPSTGTTDMPTGEELARVMGKNEDWSFQAKQDGGCAHVAG